MERKEIIEKVNHFLVEDIELEEEVIKPEAHLINDLAIDSLDIVDIIVLIEDNFGVKIKGEELAGVTTLGEFYDYIEKKINK